MKPLNKGAAFSKGIIFKLALGATVLVLSTWVWTRQHIPTYTPNVMSKFSPILRTHCIGRYLIDLPENMSNATISYMILYFGLGEGFKQVEISMPVPTGMTAQVFQGKVNARRMELKREIESTLGIPMLIHDEVIHISGQSTGTHFRSLYSNSAIISELHLLIGDRYVILHSKSYPPESAYRLERKDLFKLVDPTAAEAHLYDAAKSLLPVTRAQDARAGFCMNNVLIDNTTLKYDEEKATFNFSIPATEDKGPLTLTVDMQGKYGFSSETLHGRMADRMWIVGPFQNEMRLRKVRKTKRDLAGMSFQEWGDESYLIEEKLTQYFFALENDPPEKGQETFERPSIILNLEAGDSSSHSSPYALHQIESAWDQWTASIRLIPSNNGQPP